MIIYSEDELDFENIRSNFEHAPTEMNTKLLSFWASHTTCSMQMRHSLSFENLADEGPLPDTMNTFFFLFRKTLRGKDYVMEEMKNLHPSSLVALVRSFVEEHQYPDVPMLFYRRRRLGLEEEDAVEVLQRHHHVLWTRYLSHLKTWSFPANASILIKIQKALRRRAATPKISQNHYMVRRRKPASISNHRQDLHLGRQGTCSLQFWQFSSSKASGHSSKTFCSS
jgi:hypothetical protein